MKLNKLAQISFFVFALMLISCDCKTDTTATTVQEDTTQYVDKNLTPETKALFHKLNRIAEKGIAFGHQDTNIYGLGWWHEEFPSDSDVKKVTGDFPAVFGYEIGHVELGHEKSLDSVSFDLMKDLIKDADRMGAIITISWHADNPLTDGSSWDPTPVVPLILEGGELREKFEKYVENTANFLLDLKDDDGNLIPIIFRPWHEMTGDWFWWGGKNRTAEEYHQLFQETVKLLRDKHNVHNLLYAYSPDKIYNNKEYMVNYPGDEWIDMFGVDIYDRKDGRHIQYVSGVLELIKYIAESKGKPFAFTETGNSGIPEENWWTKDAYGAVHNSGAAYFLVWRNARLDHHYAPFPGHSSVDDFIEFKNKPDILFLEDIKGL